MESLLIDLRDDRSVFIDILLHIHFLLQKKAHHLYEFIYVVVES